MPITKFTNLDFDQIKTSIKDYLRSNSDFSGFDFEGSNFSVLLDTLAYNTYITAFNSNMVVNESFLDSATLRENVVSLARNIGYVPRSRSAAEAVVSFQLDLGAVDTQLINNEEVPRPYGTTVELTKGLVCTGSIQDSSFTFSISENIIKPVVVENNRYIANFENITISQGTYLTKKFTFDNSLDQRFILDNSFIDTSTIHVYVEGDTKREYLISDDISNIDSSSRVYFLQEVQDEKYEIRFGDGIIGKKLGSQQDGVNITVDYIVSDGVSGNGASGFSFSGNVIKTSNGVSVGIETPVVTTITASQGGADIEPIDSIKYYSPKIYSAQKRAVTPRDYEAIIKQIYPETESVAIVGGEELDPPEFGTVQISIKPKGATYISDFSKSRILSQLKKYTVAGISQKLIDLKILYVELDISAYYNYSQISTEDTLKSKIINSLTKYSQSVNFNRFGGRFKYSKMLQVIDKTDTALTSNITKVIIRRDLKATVNQFAQYELCFGNRFHVDPNGYNIKSTGFFIAGESSPVYITDVPNADGQTGVLSIVKPIENGQIRVVSKSAGVVDYIHGEVKLTTINIQSTVKENNVIEVQAFPESNDVVGLRDLYLELSVSKSTINMLRDVIASGDEISGTQFTRDFYTSSYSNGNLIRE